MYSYPITPSKPRTRSKTYLVNLVALALAGAEMHFQALQPLVPFNVFYLLAFLLPIANLIVREYTDRAVGTDGPGVTPANHGAAVVIIVVAALAAVVYFAWPC